MLIRHPACRLVVIDPASCYFGNINPNHQHEVRTVLTPLHSLAARRRCCIVIVAHLNKGVGLNSVQRVSGSMAIVAACRAVWMVGKDRDDPSRRILAPSKMNLAPDLAGMAYTIEDSGSGVAMLTWLGPVDYHADDFNLAKAREPSERDRAGDFLRNAIAGGPIGATIIESMASAARISAASLTRAKKDLGVRSVKRPDRTWEWSLPARPGGTGEATDPPLFPNGRSP
jgi:hypothetical protein